MIDKSDPCQDAAAPDDRASDRVEPFFWDMLMEIGAHTGSSLEEMVAEIDVMRGTFPRVSAVRVYVMKNLTGLRKY
jgi:predicted DNA-binding ribbon-helix-helix protein